LLGVADAEAQDFVRKRHVIRWAIAVRVDARQVHVQ
jgi:hypothetical protein